VTTDSVWKMRPSWRTAAVLGGVMMGLLAIAGGCASVQEMLPVPGEEKEVPPPVVEEDSRLEQLLTYFDLALHMSADEVKREYAVQRKLLSPGICSEPRLLAAMLMTNPSLRISAKEKKPPLLQPCLEGRGMAKDLEISRLARILQMLLDEKRKLQSTQRRLVATRYRINVLKEEIKVLNEKLEELKRIEDSIRERE